MQLCTTEQLINEYFAAQTGRTAKYDKTRMDIEKISQYETSLGKQITEMNVDELIGLMNILLPPPKIVDNSYSGKYQQLTWRFRAVFDYYIEHYEPIVNPWNKIRGTDLLEKINEGSEHLNTAYLIGIIDKLYKNTELYRAKYLELILLLFYSGFSHGKEIIAFKEANINHDTKCVYAIDHLVQLTNRCYDLLIEMHGVQTLSGDNFQVSQFVGYKGSYFHFPTKYGESKWNASDEIYVANTVHRFITSQVNKLCDCNLNYHIVYCLGLYDRIVKELGKEEADQRLRSRKDRKSDRVLEEAARKAGSKYDTSRLKRAMAIFVDKEAT